VKLIKIIQRMNNLELFLLNAEGEMQWVVEAFKLESDDVLTEPVYFF